MLIHSSNDLECAPLIKKFGVQVAQVQLPGPPAGSDCPAAPLVQQLGQQLNTLLLLARVELPRELFKVLRQTRHRKQCAVIYDKRAPPKERAGLELVLMLLPMEQRQNPANSYLSGQQLLPRLDRM
jgi:hypothetical protein